MGTYCQGHINQSFGDFRKPLLENAPVLSGSRPFWFYVSGVSYGPLGSDPHKIGAGGAGSRAVRLSVARTVSPVTQNQSTTLGHACRLRSPIFPLLCLCFV